MKRLLLAANWKMHLGPEGAREFFRVFFNRYRSVAGREVWFFPPAVSLAAVADLLRDRGEMRVGVQNAYWEPKGAFTGETSVSMAKEAGAVAALVGHSERRHVFGETDEETGLKVRALLAADLTPVLCVGERIEEREAGQTLSVVGRHLSVLEGLDARTLARVVIAYEPVWAIGTGKTATPADAAEVHADIRAWFTRHGVPSQDVRILYGGSVKPENAATLLSEPEIDGVLVGGASLDPGSWADIVLAEVD